MNAPNTHRFLEVVEKLHGRQLRRFLAARLRQAADAPDLVQEVFLRLLRVADHAAIRNPRAYLYTVASHVLHQYTLERATQPETINPFDAEAKLRSSADDPADTVEQRQLIEEFGRALEQLSPRAYATLILYRCEGLSLDQIAAQLGVSRSMVRKYLARAIAFCDRHLEDIE